MTDIQNTDEFAGWKKKAVLFLSGQTVSLFGSAIVQYAIFWHITLTTKSGPMMTLSAVATFLPQILISLFAGVWADRYNRKILIILSDILIAFSTLILAVLFSLGYRELWLLFVVSGIRAIGTGIQMPAVNALIPQIIPPGRLMQVNGINGTMQSVILLISPAVSGALLSFTALETTFFVDIATALIAVLIMFVLKVPLHKKAAEAQTTGYLDDLKEGLGYLRKNIFIKSLILFYALFFFFCTPAAYLTPLMVARSFGEEVWKLTLNEMLFFGGSIAGGIIISAWGGFKNRIHTLTVACIAFGILCSALGLATFFPLYLAIMFLIGIFMPFYGSASTVLLQERVDPDMQGRVFSLIQITASIMTPLGMVLFGPLADMVRIELLMIFSGGIMTLLGVGMFYNKGLRSG